MPELSERLLSIGQRSEAQYFSAPLGKVWFPKEQLGYGQIRIVRGMTVFWMPSGEHAPHTHTFFPFEELTPSVGMETFF